MARLGKKAFFVFGSVTSRPYSFCLHFFGSSSLPLLPVLDLLTVLEDGGAQSGGLVEIEDFEGSLVMSHQVLDLGHILQAELLELLNVIAVFLQIDEALSVVDGSL